MDIIQYALRQFLDFIIGAGVAAFMLFVILLIVAAINNMGKPKHLTPSQIGAALKELSKNGVYVVTDARQAVDIVKASPRRATIQKVNEKQFRIMEVND
jgi:hypothetical protein